VYDPATARFLSKDPIEGGTIPAAQYLTKDPVVDRPESSNLYLYCLNDPVNYTDPSGNDSKPEDRIRPGSRISNLLVRNDQLAEVKKKLSDALGVTIESIPTSPDRGYSYLVLPPVALNDAGHAKIIEALAPYKLSNRDQYDELADVMRALYRGDVTSPPGYFDRHLVVDPDTGKAYVSSAADFGASLISGDLDVVPTERLKGMVRDGFAQEIDGYIYVAGINYANKQSHQLVFEPRRLVVNTTGKTLTGDNDYKAVSAIGKEPQATDFLLACEGGQRSRSWWNR
jgi:RHS repeat-associated protein